MRAVAWPHSPDDPPRSWAQISGFGATFFSRPFGDHGSTLTCGTGALNSRFLASYGKE
jgi:hypothetical protein